ncbi:hypothetical protein ACOSQ2_018500 [Xanthoceras sorbifolium]
MEAGKTVGFEAVDTSSVAVRTDLVEGHTGLANSHMDNNFVAVVKLHNMTLGMVGKSYSANMQALRVIILGRLEILLDLGLLIWAIIRIHIW